MTTPCVIQELNTLGADFAPTLRTCKRICKIKKCGHEIKSARDCLLDVIGKLWIFTHSPPPFVIPGTDNAEKLTAATQDKQFMREMAEVPCPILTVRNHCVVMKELSHQFQTIVSTSSQEKCVAPEREKNRLLSNPPPFKRKQKRNPNPLSCLKSKKLKASH